MKKPAETSEEIVERLENEIVITTYRIQKLKEEIKQLRVKIVEFDLAALLVPKEKTEKEKLKIYNFIEKLKGNPFD